MFRYFLWCVLGLFLSTVAFGESTLCRCLPDQTCWPSSAAWADLGKQLTGQLLKPALPLIPCRQDAASTACKTALKNIHNPYYNESDPGSTQSQGWLNAWQNQASVYAVEAANTNDVVAAVNFAREHKIKLAIKGTGHDYLGRETAPDSLLIWTHNMRQTSINNSFVPSGCPRTEKGVSVISVGAGTRWIETYTEVTTKNNRYVQGGGCATVGSAGGFTQGGGFGSFSKKFGTGAAGMVEVEIVTADGKVLIANKCQNQDLFWAVRGGGGGTFGVVTKMTLMTHPLPKIFGGAQGVITAVNDDAYKKLIQQFVTYYRENLNNEHWGEQISFTSDNKIIIGLVFQGLTGDEAKKVWSPMMEWVKQHAAQYTMQLKIIPVPARVWWDYQYLEKNLPQTITANKLSGAPSGQFWWASNSSEVSKYWYTYQSWWLPRTLFDSENVSAFSDLLFKASRLTEIDLHINKGLAGGDPDAIKESKETATNPSAFDSDALIILAVGSNQVYPGVKGKEPDQVAAEKSINNINAAMQLFMQAAPQAGAYVNEADYFQKDWQEAFWGKNYSRLYSIKQKYDPDGVFYCHHCVGSERWNDTGMCLKE